jgi:hypothetical protein
MTRHKFQSEAANFHGNPNVLIDVENKTIWRILCRISVRRDDTATVRDHGMSQRSIPKPTPKVA